MLYNCKDLVCQSAFLVWELRKIAHFGIAVYFLCIFKLFSMVIYFSQDKVSKANLTGLS